MFNDLRDDRKFDPSLQYVFNKFVLLEIVLSILCCSFVTLLDMDAVDEATCTPSFHPSNVSTPSFSAEQRM
jgi:hypothetical protein